MKKGKGRSLGIVIFLLAGLFCLPWPAEARKERGAGVKTTDLPKSLRDREIRNRFIPSSFKRAGLITGVKGHVVVVHRGSGEAFFGARRDTVYENDALYTLKRSRCRIKLFSDDVISMAPDSQFSVDSYRDEPKKKRKTSFFSMLRGKIKFYALRLFRYRKVRFRVKTPTAIVGVRGTKFGLHVYSPGEFPTAGGGVLVADNDPEAAHLLAAAEEESASCTDILPMDGEVVNETTGETFQPGQMSVCGQTRDAPSWLIENFDCTTDLEGCKGDEGMKPEEEEKKEGGGEDYTPGGMEESTDQTNEQNAAESAGSSSGESSSSGGNHLGYFSAMLSYDSGDGWYLRDVFASTSRQNFDSTSVQANGVRVTSDYLKLQGSPVYGSSSLGYLGDALVDSNPATGLGSPTYDVTKSMISSNSYLEWGSWTMTQPFTAGSESYKLEYKGYYVAGDAMTDAQLAGMSGMGVISYSGSAGGTYYGGQDMTGTFNCQVDFDATSNQISSFSMSVSGGGYGASISGGSGSFTGSSSAFTLSSGTWQLTTPTTSFTPGQTQCSGSIYGSGGEAIGGTWGMRANSSNGAVGYFQGTQGD